MEQNQEPANQIPNPVPPAQNTSANEPSGAPTPPPTPSKPLFGLPIFVLALVGILLLAGTVGAAYFFFTETKKPLEEKKQVVEPSPSPTPDPTANWKIHTNNKFGLQFKYPSNWRVEESHFINVLPENYNNDQNKAVISFSYTDNPKGLTLQEFQEEFDKNDNVGLPPLYYSPGDSSTAVGGITGYQHTPCEASGSQPLSCKMYIVPVENKIFLLRTFNWPEIADQEKTFDQILSTFKFTVQDNLNNYVCPAGEYINCQPIIEPDSAKSRHCEKDYLKWAEANCPDFIVAY